MKLDYFDLIGNEPIHLRDIGNIISPLLKDINKIGIETYNFYANLTAMSPKQFYEITGQKDYYDKLEETEKSKLNVYDLIINNEEVISLYEKSFDFFLLDIVKYNKNYNMFFTYNGNIDENNELIPSGVICKENFEMVCNVILQRNYIDIGKEEDDNQPIKYKNEMARKLAERMEKTKKNNENRNNKNSLSLGKMVSKYCADNKNGINILNIFNLTIYQFYDQWVEHNNIRQSDMQDKIYSNSVSFNDTKSYDSQLWLK